MLRIHHLWVVITVTAAFIGPASSPIGLPDVLWTLLRGAWMASHGRLVDSDPFTSAPAVAGQVLNIQWLADLFFHWLDATGGVPMVITGTAVVIMITYALVLAAAIAASGHVRLSCVAIWLAYALGTSNLSPRPQTLSYPVFGFFLLAIARSEWRKDTRLLWLLPPATALWANLHGSFFTGFVLLGCAALGRLLATRRRGGPPIDLAPGLSAARPYLLALVACVLASLINPYGVGALVYVASIGSNPVIRDYVTEWAPTTVSWREGLMFFGSLLLLGALMLKSRRPVSPVEAVMLLVFGYLAWSSVRTIVWWGLLITPTLARLLGDVLPRRELTGRDVPALNALIVVGVLLLAWLSLPWNKDALTVLPADKRGLFTEDTPIKVGEYLRSHDPPPSGRMLNHQGWGGYLEWAAWPRHQVFLDGRIELHPNQVWFDYLDIVFPSARWRALVDRYNISYMVLSKAEDKDLIADLRADTTWRSDYEDDQAAVFSRVASGVP
jgi:hypothetical protein